MKLTFKIILLPTKLHLSKNIHHSDNTIYVENSTGQLWFHWDAEFDNMESLLEASYKYNLKKIG